MSWLFRSKPTPETNSRSEALASALAPQPVQAAPEHHLGPGMVTYGTVRFSGLLVLAGTLNGEIDGEEGSEVLVLEDGLMEGPIQAARVVVRGQVDGDISAGVVEIAPTGCVSGVIRAGVFRSEPGATLRGSIQVDKKEEPQTDAVAS